MENFFNISLIFLLCSCACPQSEYDSKMLNLMRSASNGDSSAALDAYDYCTSELKLYPGDHRISDFAGACGGMLALSIENALMDGDPAQIKRVLDYADLDNGDSKNREQFYIEVAKQKIAERCSQTNRPVGCNDEKIMGYFFEIKK
jgi:hypothetical protein